MTLNPQIAFFAALLTALGGPARAGSPEESEAPELKKARIGLHQMVGERPHPEPPDPSGYVYEVEVISRSSK